MNWNRIFTIYAKELRDMLRDRRTLISMIVIPTVAMPGLFALITTITVKVQREVATTAPSVMVLGGADSPATRDALLKHGKIAIAPHRDDWKQQISDKKLRAAVELPAGLDAALARGEAVAVKIYNYEGEVRSDRAVRELRSFFAARADTVVAARLAERGLAPAAIKPIEAVRTMRNLPSTMLMRLTGLQSSVSIVPRSFSPAVRSMAGYMAPVKQRMMMM